MSEYRCPQSEKHKGVTIVALGDETPHYGQLRCGECGIHIKWLSKKELMTLDQLRAGFADEPTATLICPISREPCLEGSCAWWLKIDNDIGGCLIAVIGKFISTPRVVVQVETDGN